MELQGSRVLVVGATGALGGLIAGRLAAAGASLVLTGRDRGRLAEIADQVGSEHTLVVDLVDTVAVAAAVDEAGRRLGGLDGLVVASGVAAFGPAGEDDDAVVEELFAVNTLGPMAAVRAALPRLEDGGAIAVITAILADLPTAGMASYSASKAALSAYLTAVRRELRRRRISVLDARPPHLETGLADRALAGEPPRMPAGHDIDEVVDGIVTGMAERRAELVLDQASRTIQLR
jgi:short-subunit dehydrogenase